MATAARPTRPRRVFVPLHRLANSRLSRRDLALLLPALLLSFLLNALLIGLIVWYGGAGEAAEGGKHARRGAGEHQARPQDATRVLPQPTTPRDFIDIAAVGPEIKDVPAATNPAVPAPELKPNAPSGIALVPDDTKPDGIGSGAAGGIQGLGGAGDLGFSGATLLEKDYGFTGAGGAGPRGEGSGLGGLGGGDLEAGGVTLRQGDINQTARIYGGNDASQQAVALALVWLKQHQTPDGRWSMHNYHKHTPGCTCHVEVENNIQKERDPEDLAGTALGVLPFLGAGHTPLKPTQFQLTVAAGLDYLRHRQDPSGDLGNTFNGRGSMYGHALGTIALCEAYALTQDPKLKLAAQKAINYIVAAQNVSTGGWRYFPRTDGDTSVLGWQIMALHSGKIARLEVPSKPLELATKWLDSTQVGVRSLREPQRELLTFQYMPGGHVTPALGAVGLLSRQYLGWKPPHPDLLRGADYLLEHKPPTLEQYRKLAAQFAKRQRRFLPGQDGGEGPPLHLYYWYYATQVLHHLGGSHFKEWNPAVRDLLVATQEKEGHALGSWDPTFADHGNRGGRVYATSLAALTLEVYYRYLPLYRRLDEKPE